MDALQQLASTPTPALSECSEDGNGAPLLDSAIYLKQWLLDLQLKVKAADVERHRMLKSTLHALVAEQFGEQIECLVDQAADQLYARCCSCPEDEQEADTPDGHLPLDLPAREPD